MGLHRGRLAHQFVRDRRVRHPTPTPPFRAAAAWMVVDKQDFRHHLDTDIGAEVESVARDSAQALRVDLGVVNR